MGSSPGGWETAPLRCGGRQAKQAAGLAPAAACLRLSLFGCSAWSDRHPVHVCHVGQDDLLVGAVEVGLVGDCAAAPPEDMTAIGGHCPEAAQREQVLDDRLRVAAIEVCLEDRLVVDAGPVQVAAYDGEPVRAAL